MDIKVSTGDILVMEADAALIFVPERSAEPEQEAQPSFIDRLDQVLDGMLSDLLSAGDFSAKRGEVAVLYPRGVVKPQRLIMVGVGKMSDFSADVARRMAAIGAQKARSIRALNLVCMTVGTGRGGLSVTQSAQAIAEGVLLGLYQFTAFKSEAPKTPDPQSLTLVPYSAEELGEAQVGVQRGVAYAQGTMKARDLANTPPNVCNPVYLAEAAIQIAKAHGQSITVLERGQMEALKMGSLLAVARGSENPPRFIVMEHKPELAQAGKTVVLVGKGVTFDTGGYSIKTTDGMVGMKQDMSGAAAVLGAMHILGTLDVQAHVVGIIPAVENMINGGSYRPDDVVTASNGKTIEIISTDAEGRLILADALVYAHRYNPSAIVDIATLTGAIAMALGNTAAGLYYTGDDLRASLEQAAQNSDERLWAMPLYPEYSKVIESETADIRNSGGAGSRGGAGLGAAFLKHFVTVPKWGHVDMASVMLNSGDVPYATGKTASGYGARLLAEWVQVWQNQS